MRYPAEIRVSPPIVTKSFPDIAISWLKKQMLTYYGAVVVGVRVEACLGSVWRMGAFQRVLGRIEERLSENVDRLGFFVDRVHLFNK